MICSYPETFRSAVAVSSMPQITNEKPLHTIPMYLIAGSEEGQGMIDRIKETYERIKSFRNSTSLKIVEGADHIASCENGIDAEVLGWMFSK